MQIGWRCFGFRFALHVAQRADVDRYFRSVSLPELEVNYYAPNPSAVDYVWRGADLETHAAYLAPLACQMVTAIFASQ